MKRRRLTLGSVVLGVIALMSFNPFLAQGQDFAATSGVIFLENVSPGGLSWQPQVDYERIDLIVSGDDGIVFSKSFTSPDVPAFGVVEQDGLVLADGSYRYELRLVRPLPPEVQKALADGADEESALAEAEPNFGPLVLRQDGGFVIEGGALNLENADVASGGEFAPGAINAGGNYFTGDGGFSGDLCLGCADDTNPNRELDMRDSSQVLIRFDDTGSNVSTWDVGILGTGADRFAIKDVTNDVTPFTIMEGATADSIYVSNSGSGSVGLFTSTPADFVELTVLAASGSIAEVRLEDAGSSPQIWDVQVSSNDFEIQDVTGSTTPFQIENGAGSNTLVVADTSRVGIGTTAPESELTVEGITFPVAKVKRTVSQTTAGRGVAAFELISTGDMQDSFGPSFEFWISDSGHSANKAIATLVAARDGGDESGKLEILTANSGTLSYRMAIDSSGNVGMGTRTPSYPLEMGSGAYVTSGGVWTNASSREYKENIRELPAEEAMDALGRLNPVKFNYKVDSEEKHVGFIAEEAPGLVASKQRKGLSPMDIVAVVTKVVQEQQRLVREQQKTISELSRKVMELERQLKLKGDLALADANFSNR